jgi:hypothetical protein
MSNFTGESVNTGELMIAGESVIHDSLVIGPRLGPVRVGACQRGRGGQFSRQAATCLAGCLRLPHSPPTPHRAGNGFCVKQHPKLGLCCDSILSPVIGELIHR